MNSNYPPTFIEADDRKFFISKWETEFEHTESKTDYFKGYMQWLKREKGYEAIAGLLAERDVSKVRISAHVMMTEEKLQVTALMTDFVVDEVVSLLDTHDAVKVFNSSMFDSIQTATEILKAVQRNKMDEAGLVPTLAKKYEGKNRTLWKRKGVMLKASNGVALVMTLADGSSDCFKADLGYQYVVHNSIIVG